jgi:hypothetical protein
MAGSRMLAAAAIWHEFFNISRHFETSSGERSIHSAHPRQLKNSCQIAAGVS